MIGRSLSHYKILEKLGSGGMGDVYLAEDEKLRRKVALKVIARGLADDAERRKRFEREARAVAALNHPNIVTLYSVEEVGETLFITMEYVEGITLRDLLAKGPLPLPRFLEIVQQLTAAVAAAHEAGIIHRDLKPGNIMIVKDGQVKVLDFGLAKAAEPAAFDSDSDLSTEQRTRDGVVMGTPGYMSPEQARGQSVDGRTDIYALGVLFHEMLSGRRPLEAGATSLSEKPAIPLALARIVERCHGEDPSQRFQSAADLGFALTGIAEPAEIPTRRSRSSVRWSIPIAALVLGAALGALFSGETLPTLPETHFSISPPPGYELRRDQFRAMALSRDGRKLAIVAVKQGEASLFLRNMGELGLQPVPDSEGASDPMFSPDGNSIAFFAGRELRRYDIGEPRAYRLAGARDHVGGDWDDDDSIVYVETSTGILRVPAMGGEPRVLLPANDAESFRYPETVPDSDSILFSVSENDVLHIEALRNGERLHLLAGASFPRYMDGTLFWIHPDQLTVLRVGFDPDRLTVNGSPELALSNVRTLMGAAGRRGGAELELSNRGDLAYVAADPLPSLRRLVRVTMDQGVEAFADVARYYNYPRLSPAGDRVAVHVSRIGNTPELWIFYFDSGRGAPLAVTGGRPVWSPDGLRIAFSAIGAIVHARVDGSGTVKSTCNRFPNRR